jgi:hypothetical protein
MSLLVSPKMRPPKAPQAEQWEHKVPTEAVPGRGHRRAARREDFEDEDGI